MTTGRINQVVRRKIRIKMSVCVALALMTSERFTYTYGSKFFASYKWGYTNNLLIIYTGFLI